MACPLLPPEHEPQFPRPRLTFAAFALLLGACVVNSSDNKACTLIGCQNGFHVSFQSTAWQTGTYQVELVAEGRTILCSASIPLPKSNPGNVCDAADVQLGLSGSELPVDQQSLSEVRFLNTLPKQVRVVVRRESAVLADKTFTPAYKTSQPNGPDCEPTCTNDSATLAW